MRESEFFAERLVPTEHKVRQLQTEGAELNFHYHAPSRGVRALLCTAQISAMLQPHIRTS